MIYIYVESGAVTDVHGTDDYVVVDMDLRDIGMCPKCDTLLVNDVCRHCNINWGNWSFKDVEKDFSREKSV